MKGNLVKIILICSLFLNIGAILAIANHFSEQKHFLRAKQELSIAQTMFNQLIESQKQDAAAAAVDTVKKHAFISQFDNDEDVFAEMPRSLPSGVRDATLFVFFHGLGSTCSSPFQASRDAPVVTALLQRNRAYVALSPNYRAPAGWVSDAALSDVSQNIRFVCQQYPVKRIYLVGGSMGGCFVLAYSALAPADIKKLLKGVVSIEGTGDFAQLYAQTALPTARATLAQCFGGTPGEVGSKYSAKSLIPNISSVLPGTRYAIISALKDTAVPPALQDCVYQALQKRGLPVKFTPVDMQHGQPPPDIVMNSIDFVLGSDTSQKVQSSEQKFGGVDSNMPSNNSDSAAK